MSVYRETIAISIKAMAVLALGLIVSAYVSAPLNMAAYSASQRAALEQLLRGSTARAEAVGLADAVAAFSVPM